MQKFGKFICKNKTLVLIITSTLGGMFGISKGKN